MVSARQVLSYLQFWSLLHLWPSVVEGWPEGQAENTDTQETAGLTYTSGRQTRSRLTGMSLEDYRYSWNHGSVSGQTVETSMIKLCMDISNYKSNKIYPSVDCVIQSFYLIFIELLCHCFFKILNLFVHLGTNVGFIILSTVLWRDDTGGMKEGRVKWVSLLQKTGGDMFFSSANGTHSHVEHIYSAYRLPSFCFSRISSRCCNSAPELQNSCRMNFWNPAGVCFRFHGWIEVWSCTMRPWDYSALTVTSQASHEQTARASAEQGQSWDYPPVPCVSEGWLIQNCVVFKWHRALHLTQSGTHSSIKYFRDSIADI